MECVETSNVQQRSAGAGERCNGSERRIANLLGVGIDAVNMELALALVASHLHSGRKGYVCAVGVHGILEALRSDPIAGVYARAALALPDGAPTVWLGRWQGHRHMDHVTGPALMREIIRRPEFSCFSHYFYGGKPGVAEELADWARRQSPGIRICGAETPPFRDLLPVEEAGLIERIGALRPDIIWVGISTPRQDMLMQRLLPALNTRMMFGVGAAFDFLTGRIRECPLWVKRAGFNWCHRLLQDPRRLWRRNLFNSQFLWHIAMQLSGLRSYPLRAESAESLQPAGESQYGDEAVWS